MVALKQSIRGELKRGIAYILMLLSIFLLLYNTGVEFKRIISVVIFASVVAGSLLFWRFRLVFTLVGVSTLLGLGLINVKTLLEFAGFDIILFLAATMIIVGFLEERRFFEYLVYRITPLAGSASKLVILMMILSAFFAALVGEVTSILFMVSIMFHLLSRYKLDPIPMIMMLVFATNVGSGATLVGNPVGVMIALRAGLSFFDFLRWATPISLVALVITIFLSTRYFKYYIDVLDEALKRDAKGINLNKNRGEFKHIWLDFTLFVSILILLILHSQIENLLGLEKNSMLLGAVLLGAGICLLIEKDRAREIVELRVDWWTLLFFILFFSIVGTLEYTGITEELAKALLKVAGENWPLLFSLVSIITALMSGFMDNVLAVATFIPLVKKLEILGGVNTYPLWWILLFSGTIFGNLTVIGSTANIVAVGMLEKGKLGHISFLKWLKIGLLASIPAWMVAVLLVYLQIPLM